MLGWYADEDAAPVVVRWHKNAREWRDSYDTNRTVEFFTLLPIRRVPRVTVTAQIPEHNLEEFARLVKEVGGEVQ